MPIYGHSAVYDGHDSIYVMGGWNGSTYQSQVIRYSIETGRLDPVGEFLPKAFGVAAWAGDDHIYYFGGSSSSDSGADAGIHRYSVSTSIHEQVGQFAVGIQDMAFAFDSATQTGYTLGGRSGSNRLSHIYKYSTTTHAVERVNSLSVGRWEASAAWTASEGTIYIFGGLEGLAGNSDREIWWYSPSRGFVSKLPMPMPYGVHRGCAVFSEHDGQVYIIGAEVLMKFHPASSRAEKVAIDLWPEYRLHYSACVYVPSLARIYVLGGYPNKTEAVGGRVDTISNEISYIELRPKP